MAAAIGSAGARLAALGLRLPTPMKAIASYVPFTLAPHNSGFIAHIAGQGPFDDGALRYVGRLGATLAVAEGQASARLVALNVLAQAAEAARAAIGTPDLDRLRCLKLGCFVQCVDGFAEIDAVLAPASQLMLDCLGAQGRHARLSVGKPSLPMRTSVEIDAIFEIH